MKKFINITFFTIMLLFVGLLLCSCGKSRYENLISYSFQENVNNLDPCTACSNEEITIINNIFEGLYKKSLDGNYTLGMAENVQISNDNKTYIFTLKDNIYWRNVKLSQKGIVKKVTAKDFLFAFRRLMSPNTNAPFASNYYFIKNAKNVKEGKLSPDKLGVQVNGKNQLVLNLEYETPILKELLAAPPAMPCNEDFFNFTKGRYGTSKEDVATNGPFFLNLWDREREKKVKIRVNNKYYNYDKIKIIGVNFSVRPYEEMLQMFKKQEINTAVLNAKEFNNIKNKNIKYTSFQNSVTGIIFNQKSSLFNNSNIKLALANDIDKAKINSKLQNNQFITNNLIPNSIKIYNQFYNELKPTDSCCPDYDALNAKKLFHSGVGQIKAADKDFNLNSHSILVNDFNFEILNQVLQTWQKDLGLFLKIDKLSDELYNKKLKNQNFESAVITLKSTMNTPLAILSAFTNDNVFNSIDHNIPNLKTILNEASIQQNLEDITNKYFEAERTICQNGYFIPLYSDTEYFAHNSRIKDIIFTPGSKEFYYAYAHVD